jgi:DNA-binding MarR family transcriptional regulator
MDSLFPGDDDQARLRWSIVDALRRYAPDANRIGHLFAAQNALRAVDLEALVAILGAEGAGEPLTPGRLRLHLGLSSAGTSYVIDRLVKSGHVRRSRDDPADNRVVHLRYTESGQATAIAFFGPLGQRADAVMDQFSLSELVVIERFMKRVSAMMREHVESLERDDTGQPDGPDPADAA